MSEHYQAFSKLPRTIEEDYGIAWQIDTESLGVNGDRIGLNLRRAQRASRLVGLSGVIFSEADDLVGKESASIDFEEVASVNLREQYPELPTSCQWPLATIGVNRNVILSKTQDSKNSDISPETALADELDTVIRGGLIAAASRKFNADAITADRRHRGATIATIMWLGAVLSDGPLFLLAHETSLAVSNSIVVIWGARMAYDAIKAKVVTDDWRLRVSAFPFGVQLDRYFGGAMYTRNRFVAPIP